MAAGAADWVWAHSRATNGSLIVLLAIAAEMDAKGNCVMSLAELAAKSRLSKSAVTVALGDLTQHGEVCVTPRAGAHGRNGYAVCCPDSGHLDTRGVQNQDTEVSRIGTLGEPECPESGLGQTGQSAGQAATSPDSGQQPISDVFTVGKRSPVAEVKETPAKPPPPPRPDADRLCEHLASRIEANGSKRPAITRKWRDAARLLLDKDGRTEQQVMTAIDWSQDHEFWRINIMSMPKLREKYDQLRLEAMRGKRNSHQTRQEETDGMFGRAMERARAREEAGNDPNRNGLAHPLRKGTLPPAGD